MASPSDLDQDLDENSFTYVAPELPSLLCITATEEVAEIPKVYDSCWKSMEKESTSFLWVVKSLSGIVSAGFEMLSKAKFQTRSKEWWWMELRKGRSKLEFVLTPADDSTEVHVCVTASILNPIFRNLGGKTGRGFISRNSKRALHLSFGITANEIDVLYGERMLLSGTIELSPPSVEQDEQRLLRKLISWFLSRELRQWFRTLPAGDFVISAEGSNFTCHKAILAARSPYFRELFKTRESSHTLEDVEFEVFAKVLLYVYTGEIANNTKSLVLYKNLLKAADKLVLPGLKAVCEKELFSWLSIPNLLELCSLSFEYNLPQLKKRVLHMIATFTQILSETLTSPTTTNRLNEMLPAADVWCTSDNFILKGTKEFNTLKEGTNCQIVHITDDTHKFRCNLGVHFETGAGGVKTWKRDDSCGPVEHSCKMFTVTLAVLSSATPVDVDYRFSIVHAGNEIIYTTEGSHCFRNGENWEVICAKEEEFPVGFCPFTRKFGVMYQCVTSRSYAHVLEVFTDEAERLSKDLSSLLGDGTTFDTSYISKFLQTISLAYEGPETLNSRDLLLTARKLELCSLEKLLLQYLPENLRVDNVVETLDISKTCESEQLKEHCIEFLAKHFNEVFDDKSMELIQDSQLIIAVKKKILELSL